MTQILRRSSILLLAILLFCFTTQAQPAVSSKDLPNLSKVNENLYRGGQPTEAGIGELKRLGIKTVIDLRNNDDRARTEEGWARAAGLRFINIPLSNWFSPDDKDIKSIIDHGSSNVFLAAFHNIVNELRDLLGLVFGFCGGLCRLFYFSSHIFIRLVEVTF